MDILDIDIETYSTVDLRRANVYAYAEDPAFEVLMCGWSLNGSPVEVWEGEPDIMRIPGLLDPEVKKVAHNAPFERVCLSRMAGMPVGEYLAPEQFFDTAAVAAEYGLPRDLARLGRRLQVTPKDSAGTDLIRLFCMPNKVRGQDAWRRVMPSEAPEKWERFKEYCGQDVGTMQEIRRKMPGWPSRLERDLWYLDQRINDRGMKVDVALAEAGFEAARRNNEEFEREVIEITGVENPGSTQQLGAWTRERGFPMPNWQKDTVADALLYHDVLFGDDVRRVLELRQEMALVAHRKFEAAVRGVSMDGRLRGQFLFHGAHTGRWSSKGVQVHNLARLGFTDEEGEYDLAAEADAIQRLKAGERVSPEDLKRLVRPMFLGPMASSDFRAVEAMVLAWLSGQQWVLDAFAAGRDIYVETARRMGGDMTRQQGKVAVLALGFGGGVNSLRNMGASGSDDELLLLRDLWRRANPRTHRFWSRLKEAFINGGPAGKHLHVKAVGRSRKIYLPSGRALTYRRVQVRKPKEEHRKPWDKEGKPTIYYDDPVKGEIPTYGGKLAENVTQATARDLLAEAMLRLDAAGYPLVGHVHDEALSDHDPLLHDLDKIQDIMQEVPSWAEGMPIGASASVLERYRKD